MKYILSIIILALVGVGIFALSPKCVIIDKELMVTTLNLDNRTETAGVEPFTFKVFQKKEGTWYQCKTQISRFFFA